MFIGQSLGYLLRHLPLLRTGTAPVGHQPASFFKAGQHDGDVVLAAGMQRGGGGWFFQDFRQRRRGGHRFQKLRPGVAAGAENPPLQTTGRVVLVQNLEEAHHNLLRQPGVFHSLVPLPFFGDGEVAEQMVNAPPGRRGLAPYAAEGVAARPRENQVGQLQGVQPLPRRGGQAGLPQGHVQYREVKIEPVVGYQRQVPRPLQKLPHHLVQRRGVPDILVDQPGYLAHFRGDARLAPHQLAETVPIGEPGALADDRSHLDDPVLLRTYPNMGGLQIEDHIFILIRENHSATIARRPG